MAKPVWAGGRLAPALDKNRGGAHSAFSDAKNPPALYCLWLKKRGRFNRQKKNWGKPTRR